MQGPELSIVFLLISVDFFAYCLILSCRRPLRFHGVEHALFSTLTSKSDSIAPRDRHSMCIQCAFRLFSCFVWVSFGFLGFASSFSIVSAVSASCSCNDCCMAICKKRRMQEGVHNDMLVLGFGLGIVKLNERSDQFRPIDIFFGTVEYWDAIVPICTGLRQFW